MLGRIGGRLGRVYGDSAYAGGPAHRAVAGRRQALPNAEGIFRPKAPDVRAAWERATTGYGRRNAAGWTSSRRKRTLD
jgi:hypothetical protein